MMMMMLAKRPRQVGICLKHLPQPDSDNYFHAGNVPWQRVVNAKGMVSHRYFLSFFLSPFFMHMHRYINGARVQRIQNELKFNQRGPGSAQRQADALREEGVDVSEDAMGEFYIDLSRFGWFPSMLPSEREEMDMSEMDAVDERGYS